MKVIKIKLWLLIVILVVLVLGWFLAIFQFMNSLAMAQEVGLSPFYLIVGGGGPFEGGGLEAPMAPDVQAQHCLDLANSIIKNCNKWHSAVSCMWDHIAFNTYCTAL